jgi:2-oxoglutarate dehydrogenase E2 component (dihydrolipoamide succinyltransferase)
MAAEYGIDLNAIAGTGPGGRVTREDVTGYLAEHPATTTLPVPPAMAAPPTTAAPPAEVIQRPALTTAPLESAPLPTETRAVSRPERPEERVRLSRRRLTIARRLVEAQRETASLTTFNEIDMSAVLELRRRRKEAFQARHDVSLGFMSFFVKAAVAALKAFPYVNAEMQDDELILKRYYDVGIAVDTEGGLVVPVVRNADRKSFADIEKDIAELARRARENQLTLDELRGGTFTITNGGVFGSLLSTPIINPPQVAILGMHRIGERPIALAGQVAIHPMMYVALTYDHRVIDGRTAVQFLLRIKELIEDPEALLLDG